MMCAAMEARRRELWSQLERAFVRALRGLSLICRAVTARHHTEAETLPQRAAGMRSPEEAGPCAPDW